MRGSHHKHWKRHKGLDLVTGVTSVAPVTRKGGLTDTFFKHSSQLLLVRAHGPEHSTSVRLQVKDTKQEIKP